MRKPFFIGDREISSRTKPYIVAEMSGNHNKSLERALELVESAAKAGADALKLQTYTPDTITIDVDEGEFFIGDPDSLWEGNSLYKLYGKAYTPWEWHEQIFNKAKQLGMQAFSSPFDFSSVDFLDGLDVPCYKIASFENIDIPLIKYVASKGKPIIISTGMASIEELGDAVNTARNAGCKDLLLLKCTSTYPAEPSNSNILTIPHMADLFGCQVGLSDHTMGSGVAVASVALGATFIEKHFTLDRNDGGVDSTFSLEPEEFEILVKESERAWQSMGKITYGPTEKEKKSLVFRRSLYAVTDIEAGDIIDNTNVRSIRPGLGLPPKYLDIILGRKVSKNIKKGTPLTWDIVL